MYNVSSGDSLAKNPGTIIVRRRVCIGMYMENSLPDGIVLGVSDFSRKGRGRGEMIHDQLRHFF